jgi:transposase-like protein
MAPNELAIKAALDELRNTKNAAVREVCKRYGIPRSTLRRRIERAEPHVTAHSHTQKLPPADENSLVEWILRQNKDGRAPTQANVRDLALSVLRLRHPGRSDLKLGTNWIYNFRRRNPEIGACKAAMAGAGARTETVLNEIRDAGPETGKSRGDGRDLHQQADQAMKIPRRSARLPGSRQKYGVRKSHVSNAH